MQLKDPATLPRGARRFVAYWLQDFAYGFQQRGFAALLPIRFGICASIGAAVFWRAAKTPLADTGIMVAVYAAALTLNAILLAVCWGAFAKIFDTLSDPEFGPWLRRRKVDTYYAFYVDYIHLLQMVAVVVVAAALVLCLLDGVPLWIGRATLATVITMSIYAAWWASGCVRIMQELSEHRANFAQRKDPTVRDLSTSSARAE